ncbi:unnamed protein product [Cyclocybe aegerita]|uniref:NB-ARC domain-containing protein n=1 Tax=Cyclocybe aegerita TaxID=1973307 RepID=A0A8S0WZB2_CYCAE|nr:unnamed protein product [Cyclocybe aegerita]
MTESYPLLVGASPTLGELMSAGCFSWCPFPKVQVKLYSKQKFSKSPQSNTTNTSENRAVPTRAEYLEDGAKQIVQVMEAAAGVIPVPYIRDAIRVGLRVIETCEEITAVEQQIQQLQDRVCQLLIVIIDSVTTEDGGSDGMYKAAKVIESEVKVLHDKLGEIVDELDDIKKQSRWLLFFFRDLNKARVDECISRLTSTLERFNISNDLQTINALNKIQARLEKVHALTQHVSEQVGNLHEKVDVGFSVILNTLRHAKDRPESGLLARPQMPMKPRIFHGRDELVGEIARLLVDESTSRVSLLGPGGMGKTSVSLAVMETDLIQQTFTASARFWVPCIEATSPDLFLQILQSSMGIHRSTVNPLDDIMVRLGGSKERHLLLLDNFETPWNLTDGLQREIEGILCRLASLRHVALLVTMRGTFPPSDDIVWQTKNLPPTNEQACRQTFIDIDPRAKGDPDLDKLLSTLGYMPFAVTLVAKLGKETQASASDLLDEWSRAGTDMISPSSVPEKSMNRSISLSVDSSLVKQDPDALTILATLSLLPAGTTKDRLSWWAPPLKSKLAAIATLSKAALIVIDEDDVTGFPTLFVLPVVQSFMRQQNRISDEVRQHVHQASCKFVLDHSARSGDVNFREHSAALAAEDSNIQSIFLELAPFDRRASPYDDAFVENTFKRTVTNIPSLERQFPIPNSVLDAMLAFSWYRTDTKACVEVARHTLAIARVSEDPNYIAQALFCLGSTYRKLDKFDLAHTYLEDAYVRFGALAIDQGLQRRRGDCGLVVVDNMRCMQAEVEDVLRIEKEVHTIFENIPDVDGVARSLVSLGETHWYARELETALNYLLSGKEALERLDSRKDMPVCLYSISKTHYAMQNFVAALGAIKEALGLAKELVDDEYLLADITQFVAFVYVRLDQDPDALPYLERSLLAYQSLDAPLGIAQNFEHYGFIYLRRGALGDAYAAYQAAIAKFSTLDPAVARSYCDRCSRNLEAIKLQKEHPETVFLIPDAYSTEIDFPVTLPEDLVVNYTGVLP